MEEGIHDISIEAYHSGEGYSRSALMQLKKSPYHFWHHSINPNKTEKEAPPVVTKLDPLGFGNAMHTFVLENDKFDNEYTILEKVSRATKAGKLAYEEARESGKTILCREALNVIIDMAESIDKHPDAPGLIKDASYEQSAYWRDKDTDILCKSRPDIWHQGMIVDLKTAKSASISDFSRSTYAFGYHIQAAMIREGIRQLLDEDITNFVFVVVEKEPPYAVAVYRLDEAALEAGVCDFKNLLSTLRRCLDVDRWPTYPNAAISLPGYALKDYQ